MRKSFISSRDLSWLAFLMVIGIADFARAYRLSDLFPALIDESIYLRWAEIIDHQGEWFISLLDGKQPLSYWLLVALRRMYPTDPLLGGRMLSAMAGVSSTAALFALGLRLRGKWMGMILAFMYALLPYGLLYDHIAYTDALVNLFGILSAWASLECFRAAKERWSLTILAGCVLAMAVLVKSTALQFCLFPMFLGAVRLRKNPKGVSLRIAVIVLLAVCPLGLTSLARPRGPLFAEINPLWHRSDFFTPLTDYASIANNLLVNSRLIGEYASAYITVPVALISLCGVVILFRVRQWDALAIAGAAAFPLAFQVLLLQYFPSRYVFPQMLAVLVPAAAVVVYAERGGIFVAALLMMSLGLRSWNLVNYPARTLHESDAVEFLGSGPYSGFGAREAALYLRHESDAGPFMLLTDPFWGPPADILFAYLQGWKGVKVYEAWWLQPGVGPYPLLPGGSVPVWKSQYQRITASEVNFAEYPRIYYVTDTNYRQPLEVMSRASARLVKRFPKANGVDWIDVYRLR